MTKLLYGRPKALVFDLDGTLVDSRRDIVRACNAALTETGRTPRTDAEILGMVGDGSRALVARACDLAEDDPETTRALSVFQAHYAAHPCEDTVLLPGTREVLAMGLPCALVTNKPRPVTDLVLDALGLRSAFASVWGGGDGPLKPSAEGVLHVLRALDVVAGTAWFIGDGPQDVLAGRAAGCVTVAVPGIADRELLIGARPDILVGSLHDLVAMLEHG